MPDNKPISDALQARFFAPLRRKRTRRVGVELELPVWNLVPGAATDFSAAVTLSQKTGLRLTMAVIPIIGLFIAFFWFKKRYTLTDTRLAEIENELNKRHKEA